MTAARIGPYVVEGELARGGMGLVYVARHAELGRQVALKLMLDQDDPEAVQRFLVEAQALAKLQHANFVRIHEVGSDAGRPYLAMDLIEGASLQDRLDARGPLAPREAAQLVEQLARALDHAHRKGILHRDMKPANVLVDLRGRPLVTDFGLAKDLTNQKDRPTRATPAPCMSAAPLTAAWAASGWRRPTSSAPCGPPASESPASSWRGSASS